MVRGVLLVAVLAVAVSLAFPHQARIVWQVASGVLVTPSVADTPRLAASPEAEALIRAAEGQVGVTTVYDPSYVALDFPGGDVPPERGVCTDVLIRAFRVAHGIDLQAAVNADMNADFGRYPANWGLTRPDRNIDHRRVPNLAG